MINQYFFSFFFFYFLGSFKILNKINKQQLFAFDMKIEPGAQEISQVTQFKVVESTVKTVEAYTQKNKIY